MAPSHYEYPEFVRQCENAAGPSVAAGPLRVAARIYERQVPREMPMRLWTLHPKYLDPQGLVAVWREALLARAVLRGETIGYRHHPQLQRFRAHPAPRSAINAYLVAVLEEAQSRGYSFDAKKIGPVRGRAALPATTGQIAHEWRHLLGKLERRSPRRFAHLRAITEPQAHPLFRVTAGSVAAWELGPTSQSTDIPGQVADPMISVRPAERRDAELAIDVVRRSITQLCSADHHNDEKTLATWLANKTPKNFLSWLSNVDNFCVVVESNSHLLGVGVIHRRGEILLFYLVPGAQRRGIGKMIHAALEKKADQWGLTSLHLDSTALACPFYEALGYRPIGPATARFGVLQCFPYAKQLQPNYALKRTAANRRGVD